MTGLFYLQMTVPEPGLLLSPIHSLSFPIMKLTPLKSYNPQKKSKILKPSNNKLYNHHNYFTNKTNKHKYLKGRGKYKYNYRL